MNAMGGQSDLFGTPKPLSPGRSARAGIGWTMASQQTRTDWLEKGRADQSGAVVLMHAMDTAYRCGGGECCPFTGADEKTAREYWHWMHKMAVDMFSADRQRGWLGYPAARFRLDKDAGPDGGA